ncbi:hypothetical protein [Desulfosediminicola sp.]|uniref:hypothetical protein n=1 Tax=Desulfosediminicola sp. TaxID=2886825 RepID=UPI003AF1E988
MAKNILYILGCGRSGSTLLGFVLGNGNGFIDLGEVVDFWRFKGRPNGFSPDSANYKFWSKILTKVERETGDEGLVNLRKAYEIVGKHNYFPFLFFSLRKNKRELECYQKGICALYDAILNQSGGVQIVDSSKFPIHLLHLLKTGYRKKIDTLFLIRNPVALYRAFNKNEQSHKKDIFSFLAYYFGVNIMAMLVLSSYRIKYTYISFEQLLKDPEVILKNVEERVGCDLSVARKKIQDQQPLERGFIFNGNRMRISEKVVFRQNEK